MKLNVPILSWEVYKEDSRFILLIKKEEPWKLIYKSLFFKHLSDLRKECSCEGLEERFFFLEKKLCKAEALRLLSLKGRLKKELEQKLLLKKFSKEAIHQAVAECERLGFLNEEQENENLARRLQKKGYGSLLIAAKMREKGGVFNANLVEDPMTVIQKLLEKKYKNSSREKVIASLCRRGFDYHTILDALNSQDFYKKGKGS